MKYKYKTDLQRNYRIERVEVVKETKGTITVVEEGWLGDPVEKKYVKGGGRGFHDTWAEAKAYLMDGAQWKVQYARRQLELANAVLGNIKGMKEPADEAEQI